LSALLFNQLGVVLFHVDTARMSTYPLDGFNEVAQKEVTAHSTEIRTFADDYNPHSSDTSILARVRRVSERYWLFEACGWIVALASLLSIVSILAAHNGKQSPDWQLTVGAGKYRKTFGLTINAIISILTTSFTSGLLIPVAASMSQLKWSWFNQGRPLSDYQAFDSATRGPLGSVMLLWTLRCR
jgi:hypothetical protein